MRSFPPPANSNGSSNSAGIPGAPLAARKPQHRVQAVSGNLWTGCVLLGLVMLGPVLTGCNQSSGFVMNESGKAMYAQGHYTAARREFERALLDNPGSPDYAFNVASAMRKQGDLIGAERMFRHALNLDPRHQPAHHGLADMLVDQGRVAEADSHLREWADTQPYLAEAHIENAWLRRQQGDMAGAEQFLRQALQTDPKHPVALAQLGDLYEVNGRPGEARAMYQRSLARNPFQSEVKARMAGAGRQPWESPGMQLAAYPPNGNLYPMQAQQSSYEMPAQPYGNYAQPAAFPQPPMTAYPSAQMGQPVPSPYGPAAAYGVAFPMPAHPMSAQPMPVVGYDASYALPAGSPAWPTTAGYPQSYPVSSGVGYPSGFAAPVIEGDPAHGPMTISSVPIVTPF